MSSFVKHTARIVKSNVSSRCVSTLALRTFPSLSIFPRPELKKCSAPEGLQSRHTKLLCQQAQCIIYGSGASSTSSSSSSKRSFSNRSAWGEEYEGQIALRNKSITMHPEGHGRKILPGNYVIKKNESTGVEKRVFLEHALGYFWAIKDLSLTNRKPVLSNETIIPAAEAETFPSLKKLDNLHKEVVDIPDFFTRNNRSKDASAQCTLVAISCKDFGARMLPSWTDPFDKALRNGKNAERFEIVRITVNEGWVMKLLTPFIVSGAKKNTPEKDHANTLLYFGDAEEWRDILRMHNIYTGYVFLVDGIGRVRWAGSGDGSEEEVQSMLQFAKDLTRAPERDAPKTQSKGPRVGKRVPRRD